MAGQKQDEQFEHTFSSYVRIRAVALKTCRRQWTIGRSGKRGSGISVIAARHDDDMYIYIYIIIIMSCRYIYIYIYHHHVVPLSRVSLILSCHFSLSFIASGRSSGLHPVSSHSCWMYVRTARPAFARPYVGVRRSTLMSPSLLLQQCPAYIYIYYVVWHICK